MMLATASCGTGARSAKPYTPSQLFALASMSKLIRILANG